MGNEDGNAPSRLDALEKSVGKIEETVLKISKALETKAAQEIKEPENGKEPKNPKAEDDKKKEVPPHEVNPDPEGGDVKLPKASAGETDGKGPSPAGNSGKEIVEKDLKKMVDARVEEILKAKGITKTETPRTPHEQDVAKSGDGKSLNLAEEFLKGSKDGSMTPAKMNTMLKQEADKNIKQKLAQFKGVV